MEAPTESSEVAWSAILAAVPRPLAASSGPVVTSGSKQLTQNHLPAAAKWRNYTAAELAIVPCSLKW